MEFRTKVELPIGLWQIRHSDKLMLWGSCFVEHVGKLLENNKFTCLMNPYGILYNPMSIGKAMTEILDGKSYGRDDLHYNGRIWYSLMHHGSFSALDPDDCLERINGSLEKARKQMDETDWLILTFGTSRVYEWKEDGQIVGNCHKLPS